MNEKYLGQIFSDKDLEKILDLLKNKDFSGWFGNNCGGEYMQELEKKFGDYCGTKYAHATCSGSTAIYTALRSIGVGKGDVVAVPTFTHIGSVAPIILCGAEPWFVDVEPAHGTFDPEALNFPQSRAFKAVVVQHFLGSLCYVDAMRCYTDSPIVEDASLALGSHIAFGGKMAGALGDVAAFSIGGGRTKIICAGEGGMVTTNNPEIADIAMNVRNHGDRYAGKPYFGFNFRMSELNALVALCQMDKIKQLIKLQRENAEYLIDNLPPYLKWIGRPKYTRTNYYIVGCLFDAATAGMSRNDWLKKITSDTRLNIGRGIPRRSVNGGYGTLIHEVNFYRKFAKGRKFPYSEFFRNNIVWIDWHRFPRTMEEIDELIMVMNNIA